MGEVLGLSSEPPVFTGWRAVSTEELCFSFSAPVSARIVRIDPPVETQAVSEGNDVRIFLAEPRGGGIPMTADILVEDMHGNTLNVIIPIRARNDRMPQMLINEIRTEYSNPKTEFVEFRALTAGDLGGIRLFFTGGPDGDPFYTFPPVHVNTGEYITLHLRTLDEESRDETGADLAACPLIQTTGSVTPKKDNEANNQARDLWIPGATKHLSKKGAAVYLLDQDDRVLDAVMFSESASAWWQDAALAEAAQFLAEAGAWHGTEGENAAAGPADSVFSTGTTATRTLNRRAESDTNTAGDWYICVTSGATPGSLNNPNVYAP
jgi:hypothetical protein